MQVRQSILHRTASRCCGKAPVRRGQKQATDAKGSDGRNYAGYVHKTYDLTVKGMIEYLDLYNKDFEKLAEGCHFFDKSSVVAD